jgi:hypothetical protein
MKTDTDFGSRGKTETEITKPFLENATLAAWSVTELWQLFPTLRDEVLALEIEHGFHIALGFTGKTRHRSHSWLCPVHYWKRRKIEHARGLFGCNRLLKRAFLFVFAATGNQD